MPRRVCKRLSVNELNSEYVGLYLYVAAPVDRVANNENSGYPPVFRWEVGRTPCLRLPGGRTVGSEGVDVRKLVNVFFDWDDVPGTGTTRRQPDLVNARMNEVL